MLLPSARHFLSLTLPAACLLAAMPFAAIPTDAAAQEAAPVAEVALSSGGLAEIVRTARLAGDGELVLAVPSDQVDDVLKSLLVSDPAGTVRGVALPGPDGTQAAFRTMPFQPSDLASPASLMAALTGAAAEAERDGTTHSGRVLGVSRRQLGDGAEEMLLSLSTADGEIVSVPLDAATRLSLREEALKAKLADAVDILAAARTEGTLRLAVSLKGEGERQVAIRYVVPAPVWKSAHRLVLPPEGEAAEGEAMKARLQSWAVVENFSGADWRGVRLSLTSGAPVTLKQSLHAAHWADREEVPVAMAPEEERGMPLLSRQRSFEALGAGLADMAEAAPAAAPKAISAPTAEAQGAEASLAVTYTVPFPVDLAEGGSLTLPVVDRELEAERFSVFERGAGGEHPRAAVRLVNAGETSLSPGIVTLFDPASGYTGDAMLRAVAPGEETLLAFAADRKVNVKVSDRPVEAIIAARVAEGVLTATRRHRALTTYDVTGAADAGRSLRIVHPRRPGWEASVEGATTEEESDAARLLVHAAIPAGERRQVTVTEDRLVEETYAIADADADFILSIASSKGVSEELAGKLKAIAEVRSRQRQAEKALQTAEEEAERLAQNQARLRQNLAAAPRGSDLANRYLDDLARSEDEVLAAMDRADAARRTLRQLSAELEEKVAAL
ncbi:hypothetical protein [Afifella pfennigii]|uniref:hypothetical protein n=1 Tax=Afifella pfennigii TaxID=209897 RepID=UPI000A61A700|nr:hypothetical protein [Afifella pfennigii]